MIIRSLNFNRRIFLACIFFAIATIAFTWPLATGLTRLAVGYPSDNLFFIWLIEWYQRSIFLHYSLSSFIPTLNFPEGYFLAYNEYSPLTVLLALPVTMLFGSVAGYNAVILSTFILSGLGVYLWVLRLTSDSRAGLIAGTSFAFCTYRMNHLGGHINLEATQWLPFYFFSLLSALSATKPSRTDIIIPALFLMLMGLTEPYYLYMSLVLSVIFIVGCLQLGLVAPVKPEATANVTAVVQSTDSSPINRRLWCPYQTPRIMSRISNWRIWRRFVMICLLAAPICLLSFWPYIQLRLTGQVEAHSLTEASAYSASPTDFLVPMYAQVLTGSFMVPLYRGENALYLGLFTLALAGLSLAWTRTRRVARLTQKLLVWTAAGAIILAMGVALHWLNAEVRIAVPDFLQKWWSFPQTFIPLPGYLLYRLLPFYASMRVWMRYGVFVSLFVSVLAGMGVAWLLTRVRRQWQFAATLVIVALILLDSYCGTLEVTTVAPRPVDTWLAAQPGLGAVATFPFYEAGNPEQTYYAGVYNKPYIGGHFGAFRSPQFERLFPIMDTFPDATSVATLKQLGVQYVIIEPARYPDFDTIQRKAESFGLHLLNVVDGKFVYEMPKP